MVMQVSEIKSNLQKGDMVWIAGAVGCSYPMVRCILCGYRTTDTLLSRRIIKASRILMAHKEMAFQQIKEDQ